MSCCSLQLGKEVSSASDRIRECFYPKLRSHLLQDSYSLRRPLASTTPVTAITNSLLSLPALAKPSSSHAAVLKDQLHDTGTVS